MKTVPRYLSSLPPFAFTVNPDAELEARKALDKQREFWKRRGATQKTRCKITNRPT